jgi:formylglycine-generating enzyme required for sulfatase activity
MILIPAGTCLMGSEEGSDAERPIHEVYVDDFWMDETPVTNQQFTKFVKETNYQTEVESLGAAWGCLDSKYSLIQGLSWRSYSGADREGHPVVLVSWHDALAFAHWAGKQLPSEAQWEKAARGGLVGKLYPWGDQAPDGTRCNFAQAPSEFPGTSPVRSFPHNDYGLYDMVGNVWQWCADRYGQYGCLEEPVDKEERVATEALCVRRGGAWNVIQPFRLRCSNRGAMDAHAAVPNAGFRCVLNGAMTPRG